MAYNSWKLMNKIDVAVRNRDDDREYFNGYVVEHGDKDALEKAKDWATIHNYNREKQQYDESTPPKVYTFDNEGFTVKILDSAGGSSQGGRLSFWKCEVEKDGIKFIVGVNDGILADLIRNSDISNGVVKQKVMFARLSGQPGFIHEKMEAYKEAQADMQKKADMKKAKKTSKWEVGGVYSTLTQMSICLGEMYDQYEEYKDESRHIPWYGRSYSSNYPALRKRETPTKTTGWIHIYRFQDQTIPDSFTSVLKKEIEDRNYVYFYTGKPPARAKAAQLEVIDEDLKLIDKILALRKDTSYEGDTNKEIKGRFVREL